MVVLPLPFLSTSNRSVDDIAQLSPLDSISLFLPTLIGAAIALLRRTKPKVRRHYYSRHHAVSVIVFVWLVTTVTLANALSTSDAARVILLFPINLVNYGVLGTLDLILSPCIHNLSLREKTHIPFGYNLSGTPMPGLAQWNFMYTSYPLLRIPLTLLFTIIVLSVNAALAYLMFIRDEYVPLIGLIVGFLLSITATHPAIGERFDPIRDSKQGLLVHSLTTGEKTRAFFLSFKEDSGFKTPFSKDTRKLHGAGDADASSERPVSSLFMFRDASTSLSHWSDWDIREDESPGDRYARHFPASSQADMRHDDHDGLIITARSLTAFLKERYGNREWTEGHLDGILNDFILSGSALQAVARAIKGPRPRKEDSSEGDDDADADLDVDVDDLTWVASDGIELFGCYVLMHVHAIVEQRINAVLRLRQKEDDALPFFIAAMEPKYFGACGKTQPLQQAYKGAPGKWQLSDSRVQKPDCRQDLALLGTTPEKFFKTNNEEELRYLVDSYHRMASETDSVWVRVYACCLYLIRQGRVDAARNWKGSDTQHLLHRVEDPVYMGHHLQSLLLTQLAYSAVIAVKAWLPGRVGDVLP